MYPIKGIYLQMKKNIEQKSKEKSEKKSKKKSEKIEREKKYLRSCELNGDI